jgi:predicted negative regulator of RcsB-dependent stress response
VGYNEPSKGIRIVTRNNVLYLFVGALMVVVAVMGYKLYQDRHPPEGMHIDVGPGGLSIQGK